MYHSAHQTDVSSDSRHVRVVADEDPVVLTRLIGLITSINVCPVSMQSTRLATGALEFCCELEGLSTDQWHFLLRKLSQPLQVWSVEDLSERSNQLIDRKAGYL